MNSSEKVENAFKWIVLIFENKNIPFVVTGGFAAKIYGSPRPLNDIDIDIHDTDFSLIKDDILPYVIFGPDHYHDERWDLLLATLNYNGERPY